MTATVNRLGLAPLRTATRGLSGTGWGPLHDGALDNLEAILAKTVTASPNTGATHIPRWTGQPVFDATAGKAYVGRATSTAATRWGEVPWATDTLAPADATPVQDRLEVGDILMRFAATPRTGFLLVNGDSVGSAASAADQASDDYEDLFTYLWNSIANTEAPVSGGRGANAAADWAADKTITMPDWRGSSPIGAGSGGSLTARTTGDTGGAETHVLTATEMPAHTHTISSGGQAPGGGAQAYANGSAGINSGSAGGGAAHANMHPWLAVYFFIRY